MERFSIREPQEGSLCDYCGAEAEYRLFHVPTCQNIYVCGECFNNEYFQCDECGDALSWGDGFWNTGDMILCNRCI